MIIASLILISMINPDTSIKQILRFTGRDGFERPYGLIREDLATYPNTVLIEPSVLRDGSLLLVDGGDTAAFFEPTYPAMRTLWAKKILATRFVEDGPDTTHDFSKIAIAAHDQLAEGFRRAHPGCWPPRDLRINITLAINTEIRFEHRSLYFGVAVPVPLSSKQDAIHSSLGDAPMQQLNAEQTMVNINKDKELRTMPEVKLYSEKPDQYATLYPSQRRLLDRFEPWRKKQEKEIDDFTIKPIVGNVDWKTYLALLKAESIAAIEKASPQTAAQVMKMAIAKLTRENYGKSVDVMKKDIRKAPLSNTLAFTISFCLPNGEIGSIVYPAG